MTNWLWIGSSTFLCLQWIVIHLSGIHPSPEWQSLSAGLAIFGAAFMLSWSAELAQLDCRENRSVGKVITLLVFFLLTDALGLAVSAVTPSLLPTGPTRTPEMRFLFGIEQIHRRV